MKNRCVTWQVEVGTEAPGSDIAVREDNRVRHNGMSILPTIVLGGGDPSVRDNTSICLADKGSVSHNKVTGVVEGVVVHVLDRCLCFGGG